MAGKGDDYRPVDRKKWDKSWERIFGKKEMAPAKFVRPEGHTCKASTGIHDGLTMGSGELDNNGYWEKPCYKCARAWEEQYPEYAPVWPFSKEYLDKQKAAKE
jgi:hypothetical protein